VDVSYFITKSDASTKECIRDHLLTILYCFYPEKKTTKTSTPATNDDEVDKLSALAIDSSTPEGEFFNTIMDKTKDIMTDENVDATNPMSAMMSLMQSGLVQDLMSGLQDGVGSGKLDGNKLLVTMHNALGAMIQKTTPPQQTNNEVVISSSSSAKKDDVQKTPSVIVTDITEEENNDSDSCGGYTDLDSCGENDVCEYDTNVD
jgi:hypothetical protein